jgi:hypothetical protein
MPGNMREDPDLSFGLGVGASYGFCKPPVVGDSVFDCAIFGFGATFFARHAGRGKSYLWLIVLVFLFMLYGQYAPVALITESGASNPSPRALQETPPRRPPRWTTHAAAIELPTALLERDW